MGGRSTPSCRGIASWLVSGLFVVLVMVTAAIPAAAQFTVGGGAHDDKNAPILFRADEIHLATTLTPRKIEESFASPDTMSFWDLPGFIELLEQSGFPAQRHRLHFNVLLARPFLLCAMVLVAATFSLRMQRRGGATLMIVGGVASGFLLYFVSDIVFALGLSTKIPVTLAAWTPTGVSLIFGTSMLLHLEDG